MSTPKHGYARLSNEQHQAYQDWLERDRRAFDVDAGGYLDQSELTKAAFKAGWRAALTSSKSRASAKGRPRR